MVELINSDCIEAIKTLKPNSVDCCITDLPYNVLSRSNKEAEWDVEIPFDILWPELERVVKKNGAIILFGQGVFTARMILSNEKHYRYSLIWDKCRASGFLNANRMPLRSHEDICVFYRELPTYNPQMVEVDDSHKSHSRGRLDKEIKNSCYGDFKLTQDNITNLKYPKSIISIPREGPSLLVHPTQKPVELLRWLIRTYTNKGETVLDATMGSGTTGVAAMWEDRNFIGVEKTEKYFNIAQQRIDVAAKSRDIDRKIPKQTNFIW